MDNAPAVRESSNPIALMKRDIDKMRGEFSKALPGHITADRFIRTAQTAIAMTRNIQNVKNPQSLLSACTKAAADGLILDGREAALVVDYNGEVQYRPMMRGLLKLAYQSGEIKDLVVEVAREEDQFDYSPTRCGEPIVHTINLKKPRGEVFAVYARATFHNGGVVHEVMTIEDVNRIRDRSDAYKAFKAGKIKSTPWSTDWSEMARKTVFRRLSKYLPSSTDKASFHEAVERIDDDFSFDQADAAETTTPAAPTAKKRGAAAAALRDITPAKAKTVDHEHVDHDEETGEIIENDDHRKQEGDDI
jgi:recombination protein RecT